VIEIRHGELFRNGAIVESVAVGGPDYRHLGWDHREFIETINGVNHSIYRVMPKEKYNFGPVTVPPGHYFALGDNRERSSDSRVWGFVPRELILARMNYIFFSWDTEEKRVRRERVGQPVN
jgi:signal peptidase I